MPLVNSFIAVHFTLCAIFMHLFLRNSGLTITASITGALLFTFCGYVPAQASGQPNIYASLIWLPLIMLFYLKAFRAKGIGTSLAFGALAGSVGAMQIIAGHLQPFIHTSYAAGIFALAMSWQQKKPYFSWHPLASVGLGQTIALGLAAVPVGLSLQYLRLVYRWYAGGISTFPHRVSFKSYAYSAITEWRDFWTLLHYRPEPFPVSDSLFITFVGLGLIFLAMTVRTRLTLSLWLVAIFAVAVALGSNAGQLARVSFELPMLAQIRTPFRAIYLFSFALSTLAAIGLDRATTWAARLTPRAGPVLGAVLLAAVALEVSRVSVGLGMPNSLLQYPERYYEDNPALASLERLSNQGPLVDRFLAQPFEIVPPNAGDLKQVLNVHGHRATMMIPLSDYMWDGLTPQGSDHLDKLGVRWIVTDKPVERLPIVDQGPGYYIYERPSSLSAFWLVDPITGITKRAPVQKVLWHQNSVSVTLDPMPTGTQFVFAQPLYPDWIAEVNGTSVPISQKYIFNAITLPEGAREIRFSYRPKILPLIAVSVASLLLVIGLIFTFLFPLTRRQINPKSDRDHASRKDPLTS